ncbi:MAG: hypothetical protein E7553_07115 [Ruminococcaceae bacterium]|nr:hypothetical protein [Oscillospiraceae bacterium]
MKRFFSVCICAAMLLAMCVNGVAPASVSAATTCTLSTADVREVLNYSVGKSTLGDRLRNLGDFNGDGEVNSTDSRLILLAVINGENTVADVPAIRLSSLSDVTDSASTRTYRVVAPYTDDYSMTSTDTVTLELKQGNTVVGTGLKKLNVSLQKGEIYLLTVKSTVAEKDFSVTVKANNHLVTLPYDVAKPIDTSSFALSDNSNTPVAPATVDYVKRKGGTYIYSNNPEQFASQHVGKAFMRNRGLKGEVYVTFEHANYAGQNVYLGYQLKNDSDHDVYVTVTNVGYQWTGTWFGQLAWYDFYNTSFKLPADYFTATGAISSKYSGLDYAYQNYTPRVYQPTTYRLPAGEYFWVIGGTSADAYRNINVDNSANHYVNQIRCANGNVKFTVSGGEVTGTMYCYTNASQVKAEPEALGYVADGYAQQYSGIADHHGIIDNYATWTFNDNIGSGYLPVSYTNYYDDNLPAQTAPYAAYNSTPHYTAKADTWMTHINPQNNRQAIGTDLVDFRWHDENGNEIVVDNDHADGAGLPANTANWMIEYQDHFTFVNQGNNARTITLHLRDHGTLALLVRDSQTGEVIDTAFTAGLGENYTVFSNYTYQVTVPAHSVKQITLDYLLVACSYGTVKHAVTIN